MRAAAGGAGWGLGSPALKCDLTLSGTDIETNLKRKRLPAGPKLTLCGSGIGAGPAQVGRGIVQNWHPNYDVHPGIEHNLTLKPFKLHPAFGGSPALNIHPIPGTRGIPGIRDPGIRGSPALNVRPNPGIEESRH